MAVSEIQEVGKRSVVVRVNESVNAANAKLFTEELLAVVAAYPQFDIVLNFKNVAYISSAGLRALLIADEEVHKTRDQKITIYDAGSAAMRVFEETGLTRIFRKMHQYSLEGLELIGRGTNGEIYRLDEENLIKVFRESTPLETIERERELARQALISRIPTAISYNVAHVDDRFGIVFEMLDAQPLSAVLKNCPDKYDHYAGMYSAFMKRIHQTKGDIAVFGSIKSIYADAIEECRPYYTEEEIGLIEGLIDSVPDTDTLIHGDYHPNNIMVQNDSLILIDMGDMSCGHPMFDFLATAATQVNLVQLNPAYAEMHTNMPASLITKTWRRLIDDYFSDRSEADKARIEEQICLFSKLKVALCPYFGRGVSEEILQASIDDARQNLLPKIGDLMGTVDW